MTVTVSVYQKDGLCRGPPIYDATFEDVSGVSVPYFRPGVYLFVNPWPLAAPWNPLGGTAPVYTVPLPVSRDILVAAWTLRVASPMHSPWDFFVQDGETHEVWLSRL
jgi:hypothetical protein